MFNLYNFIICNKSHYCSWDNETDKVRCDKGETINVHLTWVPPEESHLSGNEKTSQMPEGTVDTIDERMSADEIVTRLVAFHNWPCITQWHSITDPALHNGKHLDKITSFLHLQCLAHTLLAFRPFFHAEHGLDQIHPRSPWESFWDSCSVIFYKLIPNQQCQSTKNKAKMRWKRV